MLDEKPTGRVHENGEKLFERGQFEAALVKFLDAARRKPNDWNAWYWAGQCERYQNHLTAAHDYLSRAARIAPREPAVLLALGIAAQLLNRFPEAIDVLARAIAVDEDFAAAYNSLALTQKKMGELDKALNNYDAGTKGTGPTIRAAQLTLDDVLVVSAIQRAGQSADRSAARQRARRNRGQVPGAGSAGRHL